MSFEIKLPLFEGPFDLMLFFIERDELDIYDIPIARIIRDFLAYIEQLEQMEIEVASEFILFAATLMKIKSKMLIPRPELNEDGEEVDPREELIRHLVEYKKYKSVVGTLAEMEERRLSMHVRGNVEQELKSLTPVHEVEAEVQDIDLYKLLKVYQRVLGKFAARAEETRHTVIPYPYTIEQQKAYLLDRISLQERIAFTDIITENPDKIRIIYTFLAILELLQASLVTIRIGEGFNNFWVEKTAGTPTLIV
ncbi:MAG: segregation and condensation protein A [Nitritalea sp.]